MTSALNDAVVAPTPVEKRRISRRLRSRRPQANRFYSLLSIIGGFALWELVARAGLVDELFLPPLSSVLAELGALISDGSIGKHVWASGSVLIIGLALSILGGFPLGLLIGRSKVMDTVLSPWLMAFNSVPRIAFIPMLVVVFGIGVSSKVTVVILSAAFPLIINVAAGARTIDPLLVQMARSMGAKRRLVFRAVIIPGVVPFALAGFRVALAQGLIAVVVAELFAATAGIGFLLFRASSLYDIPLVYAMILVLGAAGVLLSQGAKLLERKFESWRT
jgi:NitT/TauT family transport system permease protein